MAKEILSQYHIAAHLSELHVGAHRVSSFTSAPNREARRTRSMVTFFSSARQLVLEDVELAERAPQEVAARLKLPDAARGAREEPRAQVSGGRVLAEDALDAFLIVSVTPATSARARARASPRESSRPRPRASWTA